jgi:uncharacterized protein (TIGR02145 family)
MKIVRFVLCAKFIATMMLTSCTGGITNVVTIGQQVWMSENLNVDKFRNGDPIPEVKTDDEWENAGNNEQPAWCYYNNDPANGDKYGKLYNWYAIRDPRGLAPEGWHVLRYEEWGVLVKYLGGDVTAGLKIKNPSGWTNVGELGTKINIKSDQGTNETGFSGLPGGYRFSGFHNIGAKVEWWSSTSTSKGQVYRGAHTRTLSFNDGWRYNYVFDDDQTYKSNGCSVRCVKD